MDMEVSLVGTGEGSANIDESNGVWQARDLKRKGKIYSREKLLTEGSVILLQTAPIDPRSLMQGDYMALRFQEGDAGLYSKARYGEFRAGADGESILTGMRDEQLSRLGNSLGN